jgi:hypothetical protein
VICWLTCGKSINKLCRSSGAWVQPITSRLPWLLADARVRPHPVSGLHVGIGPPSGAGSIGAANANELLGKHPALLCIQENGKVFRARKEGWRFALTRQPTNFFQRCSLVERLPSVWSASRFWIARRHRATIRSRKHRSGQCYVGRNQTKHQDNKPDCVLHWVLLACAFPFIQELARPRIIGSYLPAVQKIFRTQFCLNSPVIRLVSES